MPAKQDKCADQAQTVIKVFGINNCDSCRNALKWLKEREIPHRFHDIRDHAPDAGLVKLWCDSAFSERLLNRRSTTWRSLNGRQRAAALANPAGALMEHPTLLKRPVFMRGKKVLAVGFYPADLEKRLA